MPIESILIGAIVAILCGAVCFYLYIRLSFVEKKMQMVESILVDLKMAMDGFMMEGGGGPGPAPTPISHSAGGGVENIRIVPKEEDMMPGMEAEVIPEENFYSSVLAAAHEEAAEPAGGAAGESAEEALQNIQRAQEEVANSPEPMQQNSVQPQVGVNLDAMTKAELVAMAEQRGLRARKTMNRSEILALLRNSDATRNQGTSTGVEHGPLGSLFSDGAPLEGDAPVDLGQADSSA